MSKTIILKGRVLIRFDIEAATSLHIGGTETGLEIGGVDKTVIREPLKNRPYIPGSSLKGKMRSLLEKYRGLKQNQNIGKVYIHSCGGDDKDPNAKAQYLNCDICQVFGVPGEREFATPTRIVVRDAHLSEESASLLDASGRTALPYTEVKTEVAIDRVTSAASPRQMERVPAGSIFGPAEIIYNIYEGSDCHAEKDAERLGVVFEGLQLLEDDYLGGLGSRGSGKVCFRNLRLSVRSSDHYTAPAQPLGKESYPDLAACLADLADIRKSLADALV